MSSSDPLTQSDSPLSTTASVASLLTFIYAIAASVVGYIYLFRSSTPESIERFYEAFAACALETDLVRRDIVLAERSVDGISSSAGLGMRKREDGRIAVESAEGLGEKASLSSLTASVSSGSARLAGRRNADLDEGFYGAADGSSGYLHPTPSVSARARPPPVAGGADPGALPGLTAVGDGSSPTYLLDPDSLSRLYSHVRAVEIELQNQAARVIRSRPTETSDGVIGNLWQRVWGRGRWASRARELEESLAKREALTARLLVVQMSLLGARVTGLQGVIERLEGRVEGLEKRKGDDKMEEKYRREYALSGLSGLGTQWDPIDEEQLSLGPGYLEYYNDLGVAGWKSREKEKGQKGRET